MHMRWNREQLLEALREGAQRATLLKRSILVSLAQPIEIEPRDLIPLFMAAQTLQPMTLFYWEHTADHTALLGIETSAEIQVTGPNSFAEASRARQELFQGAVVSSSPDKSPGESGPLLFGGFAFDPLCPRSTLWEGFPDGLLLLPTVLIHCRASGAALHLQTMVQPTDDAEQVEALMSVRLERLQAAFGKELSFQQASSAASQISVQDGLPALEWMELVGRAAEQVRRGYYRKVVLARALRAASTPDSFSVGAILQRLRASHPEAYRFALQRGARCFVGATPEQLARVEQGAIQTMALAGSAPPGAARESDARLDDAFLWSAKNREEHAIVVEMICDALAQVCSEISAAREPRALKLKNIQHLQTAIQGTLRPGVTVLDVLAVLHPTPAVGGLPSQAAREMIRASEQLDRGWYAGPIGWIDARGNGEFAAALRSALVRGNEAILFAGCGIVAGSDPVTEYAESSLKFQTMLAALSDDFARAAAWLSFVNTARPEPERVERRVC